ncbi:MAG: extracellular solute-binding protein [Chloroflexi bacterium]|nr:extracellular solute-binding protein [Chloroflexota bacterium]
MRNGVLAMVGAGVIALSATGGVAAQSPAVEPVQLTMLADVNDQLTAELWNGLFARFTEAHPNVTVSLVPTPSGEREDRAKTLLQSGDFPDVQFPLPTVTFKDELLPFDLNDPEISGQLLNIDKQLVDGQLLGLGIDSQPWNTIFYNKDMFDQAGITKEPTTFAEFEDVLAKLKAAGFAPILGVGEWVPHFTFMATNDIFAQSACWLGKREANEVSFSDPEWVEAAQRFAGWVKNGYFNEGPLGIGYTQGNDLFLQGGAAMYPIGSWLSGLIDAQPPEFQVGYFAMPNRDGDLKLVGSIGSTGFTVSKTSEHPAEAVALAKFLAFDEESITTLLNALGFQSNVALASGPMEGLKQTALGIEIAADVANAIAYNTAWNGQSDCAQRAGAQIQIGTAIAEPLYLDPNQAVEPLLASMDQFWTDAVTP